MYRIFTKDLVINYYDQILDYIIRERDYLKKLTDIIRYRRNSMYELADPKEWDEINYAYNEALFLQLYSELADKLSIPIDELYCELEVMELSKIFEPSN